MFKRFDVTIISNPACTKPVEELDEQDFDYYDKDGFELCRAEQKFYRAMKYPIDSRILNHTCWQEPWFALEENNKNLILDHCMFLCRSNFEQHALEQLIKAKSKHARADLLIKTKPKWGFDFALDAVINGEVFEVLHIEYDHRDYDVFQTRMLHFDYKVRHTDWIEAAKQIYGLQSQWQHLKGFAQNHWKAKYLLGWDQAEYTEKSI